MLPKKHRIRKDREFGRILRNSKIFYTPLLRLKIKKNSLGYNRFAVVVSAKISKKATVRNKIRRRIYEILR
ncbi:ribonuclease P protein component, partial [Candidatus Parcubacteria bacterium]